jgi:hypothetical protein
MWYWIIGSLTFLIGLVIGISLRGRQDAAVQLGFAALGCLLGLLVGLSQSQVVAATLSAAFTLAGTLITVLGANQGKSEAGGGSGAGPPQAGLSLWILPFASLAIVGLFAGIILRVNNSLDLAGRNLRSNLQAQGFTDAQVDLIMDRFADTVEYVPPEQNETNLFTQKTETKTWPELWPFVDASQDDADKLRLLREDSPAQDRANVRRLIDKMQQSGKSPAEIIQQLKVDYGGGP